jgi:hypothetical protein
MERARRRAVLECANLPVRPQTPMLSIRHFGLRRRADFRRFNINQCKLMRLGKYRYRFHVGISLSIGSADSMPLTSFIRFDGSPNLL